MLQETLLLKELNKHGIFYSTIEDFQKDMENIDASIVQLETIARDRAEKEEVGYSYQLEQLCQRVDQLNDIVTVIMQQWNIPKDVYLDGIAQIEAIKNIRRCNAEAGTPINMSDVNLLSEINTKYNRRA